MSLQLGEQAAGNAAHVADGIGLSVLLTVPFWWQILHENGQTILLVLGIVYAIQRIVIGAQVIHRNWRRAQR